jgi:hypothetical protein
MAQLTVKELIGMEFALQQLLSQAEKLPLDYEWDLRVFLYQTTPYMGAYKGIATRLLEKRYGKKKTQKGVKKGDKPIVFWVLDPEKEKAYEQELEPLHNRIVPINIPSFNEKILKAVNVSYDKEILKPFISKKDAQINNK